MLYFGLSKIVASSSGHRDNQQTPHELSTTATTPHPLPAKVVAETTRFDFKQKYYFSTKINLIFLNGNK